MPEAQTIRCQSKKVSAASSGAADKSESMSHTALDNESERVVQESLEKLAKNRTTFVIAHRLTTIQNAQKILVLTEDGIAESGSHEELLARGGVYEKLYHMHY